MGNPKALYASPLRRSRETAEIIATQLGFPLERILTDSRIRERMNWPGQQQQSLEAFEAEWTRATADRRFDPTFGDSSIVAGERFESFIRELSAHWQSGSVIVVSHGGVTLDLVRTIFGDAELAAHGIDVLRDGIRACHLTEISVQSDEFILIAFGRKFT